MLSSPSPGDGPRSHWTADEEPLLHTTVGGLLRRVAQEVPDRVALIDGSAPRESRRRWTYAELLARSQVVAAALRRRFEPGDRVALWARNSPEWTIVQLGAAMSGVVLVGIDPAFRAREMTYVMAQSGAAGVIHDDTAQGLSRADMIEQARGELPALRLVLDIAGEELWDDEGWAEVELPQLEPSATVQIQYTSGTTGFPKGAQLHHLAVINTSFYCARRGGFTGGGVWINMLPLAHIAGSITATYGPMTHRGTMVILDRFKAAEVLQIIEEEQGTLTLAVPTMLIAMLEDPSFDGRDLSSLRSVISGAATVPVELVERVKASFECDVSIVYGMTEGPIVLQTHVGDSLHDQAETLGQPQANVELGVFDVISGEPVPCGEPGEIWIRAYSVMNGYFDKPEATVEALSKDGWLRTGDLAVMDDRGFVRITGRLKDMIIRGGENLYPREIEELIFTHPAVVDVAVVGVPHESLGEVVAAVVRVREGADFQADDLAGFCAQHLARSKVPGLWSVVEEFPMTPSGKIQKHVLKKLVADGTIQLEASGSRDTARPGIPDGAQVAQ